MSFYLSNESNSAHSALTVTPNFLIESNPRGKIVQKMNFYTFIKIVI